MRLKSGGFICQFGNMSREALSSRTDQVVDLLRQGMVDGRWEGTLPGRDHLAYELGCSDWTVEVAIRRLTMEGLLESQGAGRRRRINLSQDLRRKRSMRVMILLYEKSDRRTDYLVDLFHRLQAAGHQAEFASKTITDLGMDAPRVAGFVQQVEADAWIVVAGPLEVLEWFSQQPLPNFALFGRVTRMPLASASLKKASAMVDLVNRLIELGHRRIVMLAREERRKPTPGLFERLFLEQLEKRGIQTSAFNLPEWSDTPEELRRVLGALFRHTPPTALIIDDPAMLFPTTQHLARLGYLAPEQISLACTDSYPGFEWCSPAITHIQWNAKSLVQRVVKWAENVSRGKEDRRKTTVESRLVIGGTIGPAPR